MLMLDKLKPATDTYTMAIITNRTEWDALYNALLGADIHWRGREVDGFCPYRDGCSYLLGVYNNGSKLSIVYSSNPACIEDDDTKRFELRDVVVDNRLEVV